MVINDNFGKYITALLRAPSTLNSDITLVDTSGVNRTVRVYGSATDISMYNEVTTISHAQVGEGTTPATSQDFKLEDPFSSGGAEDNQVVTTIYVQVEATGTISMGSLFSPTGGAGQITEAVKTQNWRDTSLAFREFLMFRNTFPFISFILGQSISLDTIIQL